MTWTKRKSFYSTKSLDIEHFYVWFIWMPSFFDVFYGVRLSIENVFGYIYIMFWLYGMPLDCWLNTMQKTNHIRSWDSDQSRSLQSQAWLFTFRNRNSFSVITYMQANSISSKSAAFPNLLPKNAVISSSHVRFVCMYSFGNIIK